MQLPIVTTHADIFRDLFENRCQFHHFQHYLTGLIVLDNKSLANITHLCLCPPPKQWSRYLRDPLSKNTPACPIRGLRFPPDPLPVHFFRRGFGPNSGILVGVSHLLFRQLHYNSQS